MEELVALAVPWMVNGHLWGFQLFWKILLQNPPLLAFFAFLLLRKIKRTFFG